MSAYRINFFTFTEREVDRSLMRRTAGTSFCVIKSYNSVRIEVMSRSHGLLSHLSFIQGHYFRFKWSLTDIIGSHRISGRSASDSESRTNNQSLKFKSSPCRTPSQSSISLWTFTRNICVYTRCWSFIFEFSWRQGLWHVTCDKCLSVAVEFDNLIGVFLRCNIWRR
jgi:hypothetical protein